MAKSVIPGKTAEQRLRARIRRSLGSLTDRTSGSTVVEDEVLRLIKRYGAAAERNKEKVYREGERRLLKHLRSRRKAAA